MLKVLPLRGLAGDTVVRKHILTVARKLLQRMTQEEVQGCTAEELEFSSWMDAAARELWEDKSSRGVSANGAEVDEGGGAEVSPATWFRSSRPLPDQFGNAFHFPLRFPFNTHPHPHTAQQTHSQRRCYMAG